jgi:hypothetical protein
MAYRLDEIIAFCEELGFESKRVDDNRIEVDLSPDGTLVFMNIPEENDTFLGFEGTPWHGHDKLTFLIGESSYIELDELEVLLGIQSGEILVMSQYLSGSFKIAGFPTKTRS